MSGFYADLIVPDLPPLEAARTYTADELAMGLKQLAVIAEGLGLAEIWGKASLIGSDRSQYLGGPAGVQLRGVLGVSLAWACLPGIGFYRDTNLAFELVSSDSSMVSRELAILRAREERQRSEVTVRGPEVDAVHRIAAAAAGWLPFTVRATIDVQGSWAYDFDVAYRRRLAYALAFEASITRGTLAPFEDRFEALTLGSLSALAAILPDTTGCESFSVCLNLLAILDMTWAYEKDHAGAAPTLPGRIKDAEPKRALLAARLQKAAAARMTSLSPDGRIGVRGLLVESRYFREHPVHYNGYPPVWGGIASSESFCLKDA